MQITRKVLLMEFNCIVGKKANVIIQKPKADLTHAIINPIAQQMIASHVIKNDTGSLIASVSKVYYSEVAIQDIAL